MAVSEWKCRKMLLGQSLCIDGRRNWRISMSMCSVVWTMVLVIAVTISRSHAADSMNCANVKYTYEARGMGAGVVPKDPLSGVQLRVCPKERTCCTPEMEHQLSAQSRQEFDKAVKDTLAKLAAVLKTRSQRFDEFFKALLATSKREFHDMFKRTYGIIYEQNSYVFTDMFEELEKYYAKGQVDLGEAMENFFNTLYLKIFSVMNGQYHFDDKYLNCVGEHMKDLKPFGDAPQKLTVQLKRSFIATRTFSQALQVACDVVNHMQKINPSPDCLRALMKMTGCPHCQGVPELKACSNYCINVMKGCLAYQAELNSEWNNFVEQMEKVSDRLLGPFNIEMVVEPINIKISEAIMNFQESGQEISQRVFQGCGKPVLGRRRRSNPDEPVAKFNPKALGEYTNSWRTKREQPGRREERIRLDDSQQEDNELHFADKVYTKYSREQNRPSLYSHVLNKRRRRDAGLRRDTTELEFETLNFGRGGADGGAGGGQGGGGPGGGASIEKLVRDVKTRVRDSKQFWANLPYTICNDDHVAASPAEATCWNGATKAKYEPQITGDGITNQLTNPEVEVDVSRPSSLLNEQVFALKTITSKLKSAYQGMDVEWFDNEETSSYDGSGGSGSGSGSITDNDVDEGSGGGGGSHNYDVHHSGSRPHDNNSEDNNLPPVVGGGSGSKDRPPGNAPGDGGGGGTSAAADSTHEMSALRAVSSYLLPIVVMWFGGIFADWL